MRTIPVQNSTFDTCDTCGGVWFDEEELKKTARAFAWGISAQVEEFTLLIKENDVPDAEVKTDLSYGEGVACPVDGNKTTRFIYAGDSKIILDRCAKCHGTWFDGDELIHMAGYLKPSARDLMGKLMVTEMKNTEKLKEEMTLLPFKIAGMFSSPTYLAASVITLLIKYAGFRP
jgi:Zn-finger nucleic acid-binding protein